jgi:hypothetical protein
MCASAESTNHHALSTSNGVARVRGRISGLTGVLLGAVILSMVVHLGVNAVRSAAPWTNNDTAFIVYIAQQMNAGARLYVDWVDTDPPSIFFIALAGLHVSQLTHLPLLFGYDLITVAVGTIGLFVIVHALGDLDRPSSAVLVSAAAFVFFMMKPGAITRDFGQREHLFALVLIPELFASASPRRVRWRPAWCALVAFMAMMKPQFIAILAVLEVTAPRAVRLRPADVTGFVAGAVAPLAMLWWHSPESFRALFTDALAIHFSGYAFLNESPSLLLKRGPLLVVAVSVVALAAMAVVQHRDRALRPLAIRGGLGLICCALSVVNQHKYFPYHFVPLFGLAIVCAGWATGEYVAGRHQSWAVATAAIVMSAGLAFFHADIPGRTDDPVPVRLGHVTRDDASLLVASVYLHGLCTPFAGAPRCIGPEVQTVRLPQMAWAPDSGERLRRWAETMAGRLRNHNPDLLALSTGSLAMPDGLSPARLLVETFPMFPAGEYVRLSPAAAEYVDARNFLVFRRRDVRERVPAR